MQNLLRSLLVIGLVCSPALLKAQRDTTQTKGKKIDTQNVIIVKPYSPTIDDAVKLKELPIKDSLILQRHKLKYNILNVPVASTFVPEKGEAADLDSQRGHRLYDYYFALGLGNYTDIYGEAYGNVDISKTQNFNFGLQHNSSAGGIKGIGFKDRDEFSDTRLNLTYNQEEMNLYWSADLGLLHQYYNWYGVFSTPMEDFKETLGVDPKHNFYGAALGGNIKMKEGVFNGIGANLRFFGDDFHSREVGLSVNPKFNFAVGDESLNVKVNFDYLSGRFKRSGQELKYEWLNLGIQPSYNIREGDLSVNIGVLPMLSSDGEHSKNDFYFYPKVKASYKVAGDYFSLYGGVDGGLEQNSYYSFVQENPFVAPLLTVRPTRKQYDVYLGGKGKFTKEWSYDLKAGYKSDKDSPFYAGFLGQNAPQTYSEPYDYDNSFRVVYDDLKTFYLHGALNYHPERTLSLGVKATYFNYSNKRFDYAYDHPDFKAGFTADYDFLEKWSAKLDLLFMGKRHGVLYSPQSASLFPFESVKMKSYFDANLRVDYQLNDHLGLFVRGNNLTNSHYEAWYRYKVQGIQGMIGASYQF